MKHEHMLQFRLQQIWELFRLCVALCVAVCMRRRSIWLVCERGTDARDNGYWFFKYVREQHPEQEVYYLIKRASEDYAKLLPYADHVVEYKSMKHYVLLWRASHLLSTHVQGYFAFAGLGLWIKKMFPYYAAKKHIGLKHGITKDHMSFLDYSNTGLDMIVAGVKPEYDYFISDVYGYPSSVVNLTGHCRFDQLNEFHTKRQILYMPTWREWLYKDGNFAQSEYAQKMNSLLHNSVLTQLLAENDLQLVFYPHYEVQKHIGYFMDTSLDEHIVIADKVHYDVQQLLKESLVLITDYSSVFFDFAYMQKPILFYQFDNERYRLEHYAEGWYDYRCGLGKLVEKEDDLVFSLSELIKSGFRMEEQYIQLSQSYFAYRDASNCERVYNAVLSL